MKALIVYEKGRMELADIPKPIPGPYDALVQIEACGICNSTDMKLIEGTMFWAPPFPIALGHESVGRVVECGKKVRYFKTGNRVTRPVYVPPPEEKRIKPACGGFAEFGLVHDLKAMLEDGDGSLAEDFNAKRQIIVPDGLGPMDAALSISLSETASVLYHLPEVRGRNIVVAGTGVVGLAFALWLKLGGARVYAVGRRKQRLEKMREIGADVLVNTTDPDWFEDLRQTLGGKAHGMIEATGDAALAERLSTLLDVAGFACAYGVPPKGVHYPPPWQEAKNEEFLSFDWVADMMLRKWVSPDSFITHRWNFDQISEAFEAVARGDVIKGIVRIGMRS